MQNEPPIEPISTPQDHTPVQSHRKKFLIAASIIGLVLISLAALYFAKSSPVNNQPQSKTDSNTLVAFTPDPAKVGTFPAIGACQVLSKEDVYSSFGKDFLPVPNVTNETYQQLTLPNLRYGAADAVAISECEHVSAVSTSSKNVSTAVIQFQTLEQRKKKMTVATNLEAQSADDITKLKNTLKNELSPEGMTFLTNVAQTTKTFSDSVNDPDADMPKILDGKVLLGVVKSSSPSEFAAEMYAKNAVISLSIVASDEPRVVKDITNKQMATMIDSIRKASEIIYQNMKETSKLTDPAPTADRKTVPSSGELAIVDACNVLTPKSFVTLSGVEENSPLERTNFRTLGKMDLTTEITNHRRYSTSCTRQYKATKSADAYVKTSAENIYGLGGYARINLDVGHAKNDTAITEALQPYREPALGTLKTNANEAYRNTINPNLAIFRKGKYIVRLSVDKVNVSSKSFSGGQKTEIPASEAELVAAINEFVDKLQ